METEKLKHLDEAIRHSLEEECNIRNTRTNWFLVFQAALGNGVIELLLSNVGLGCRLGGIVVLSLIGFVISISFAFAAWRSEKAISMLFTYWDQIRCENGMKIADNYPVSPINDHIISNYFAHSYEEDFETSIWEHKLAHRMNLKKWDKIMNKHDEFMPYKFLPRMFLLCWIIIPILAWIFSDYFISLENVANNTIIMN